MLGQVVGILIILFGLGLAWYGLRTFLLGSPVGEPWRTAIDVVLNISAAVICVFYVLIPLLALVGVHVVFPHGG